MVEMTAAERTYVRQAGKGGEGKSGQEGSGNDLHRDRQLARQRGKLKRLVVLKRVESEWQRV